MGSSSAVAVCVSFACNFYDGNLILPFAQHIPDVSFEHGWNEHLCRIFDKPMKNCFFSAASSSQSLAHTPARELKQLNELKSKIINSFAARCALFV